MPSPHSRKAEAGETNTVAVYKAKGYVIASDAISTEIPTAYAADSPTPPGVVIYVK